MFVLYDLNDIRDGVRKAYIVVQMLRIPSSGRRTALERWRISPSDERNSVDHFHRKLIIKLRKYLP